MRFKIVNQTQVLVIEKFGKFDRLGESGVNFLKFGEKVVADIDTRTQILSTNRQEVITSDSVILDMDAVVYFKVTDVMKAAYSVQDYQNAMLLLIETSMRNEIAKMKMQDALSNKDQINENLAVTLKESTTDWGLRVERVEIRELKPSAKMAEAMEKERVAELDRKAKVAEAKGEYDKKVTEAEGKKQSRVLNAIAEKEEAVQKAESIKTMTAAEVSRILEIANAVAKEKEILGKVDAANAKLMIESLKEAGADESVITLKYIEAMQEMAKGDNKVFFPFNENIGLNQVGVLAEVSTPQKKEKPIIKEDSQKVQNEEIATESNLTENPNPQETLAEPVQSSFAENPTAKKVASSAKNMISKGIGMAKNLKH